jgi:hypothetical protein
MDNKAIGDEPPSQASKEESNSSGRLRVNGGVVQGLYNYGVKESVKF